MPKELITKIKITKTGSYIHAHSNSYSETYTEIPKAFYCYFLNKYNLKISCCDIKHTRPICIFEYEGISYAIQNNRFKRVCFKSFYKDSGKFTTFENSKIQCIINFKIHFKTRKQKNEFTKIVLKEKLKM